MLEFRKCNPLEYYGDKSWDQLFVVSKNDIHLGLLYFIRGTGWWWNQRKLNVRIDDLDSIVDFTRRGF